MSTKLKTLQEAALAATKTARELAEKAGAENRTMSEDERSDYEKAMAQGRDLLDQIKAARADEAILAEAKALADEIGPHAVADVEAQKDASTGAPGLKNLGRHV